jgi:hypothetical protein
MVSQQELYIKALTTYNNTDRCTLSVNGGIASGKGTSAAMLESYHVEDLNRGRGDKVRINGDSYKPFFAEIPQDRNRVTSQYYSQLCQDEANWVSTELTSRLAHRIRSEGKGPDVFIDKAVLPPEWLGFITEGAARLVSIIVTIPVDEAIIRASARGEVIGRFEATDNILTTHKNSADGFVRFLEKNQGKNVTCQIYDNSQEAGQPKFVAEIDCTAGTIEVMDKELMTNYLKKRCINLQESKGGNVQYNDTTGQYEKWLVEVQKIGYSASMKDAQLPPSEKLSFTPDSTPGHEPTEKQRD